MELHEGRIDSEAGQHEDPILQDENFDEDGEVMDDMLNIQTRPA